MHLCCANDTLRPVMNNIYIEDCIAYATDGHILVANHLDECTTFDSSQAELLNGKFIHRSDYAAILKHNIVIIKEDGILAINGTRETKYFFNKDCGKFPNGKLIIDQIEKKEPAPVSKIGMNISFLDRIKKGLSNGQRVALFFKGEDGGILAKNISMSYKSVGLLMPLTIYRD